MLSTFRTDGYNAALRGEGIIAEPANIYDVEFNQGWQAGSVALANAAPDLLAALQKCAAYIEQDRRDNGVRMDYADDNALNAARAAIARATGE